MGLFQETNMTQGNSWTSKTGWWFWNIFYFPIYWEYSSQLTNIFQRGSNHQPEKYTNGTLSFVAIDGPAKVGRKTEVKCASTTHAASSQKPVIYSWEAIVLGNCKDDAGPRKELTKKVFVDFGVTGNESSWLLNIAIEHGYSNSWIPHKKHVDFPVRYVTWPEGISHHKNHLINHEWSMINQYIDHD